MFIHISSHTGFAFLSDRVTSHFQLAVNLLNEGWSGAAAKDHNVVADKIRRRLVREKRLEDAARFSGLINKLMKSVSVLHLHVSELVVS